MHRFVSFLHQCQHGRPLDEAGISDCCGEDLWSEVEVWGPFHNLHLPLSSDLFISTIVCSIPTRYKGRVADSVYSPTHMSLSKMALSLPFPLWVLARWCLCVDVPFPAVRQACGRRGGCSRSPSVPRAVPGRFSAVWPGRAQPPGHLRQRAAISAGGRAGFGSSVIIFP